jgi:cell wall-associated NlpC family hydrolase
VRPCGEGGAVAIAAVALLLVLALVAGAGLRAGRGLVLDERVHGSADAVALAAASVLEQGYGDAVDAGGTAAAVHSTERAARSAAARAAGRLGVTLVSAEFERGRRDPSPIAVRVRVLLAGGHGAGARAGIAFAEPATAEGFRVADLRGLGGAPAVVAAALAQLGWPYVWGGESRAEGGFDCSGLVDYAFAAAGLSVGRPTAAGLQELARPLPIGTGLRPGDLVFAGRPAHHVGLVVAPGLAVEAPHRGARVHVEPLGEGNWTDAGRLLPPGGGGAAEDAPELAVPAYVPPALRPLIARAARSEQLPPALLAAQLEAESGFDVSARSPAGAEGIAQFMRSTWTGAWNPQRLSSPFDPAAAITAQARLMHLLLEQTGGDVAAALAAYNAGPAALPGQWPRETRAYVARVMRRFGGPTSLGAALPPELVAAGVRPASGRMEVRLLP